MKEIFAVDEIKIGQLLVVGSRSFNTLVRTSPRRLPGSRQRRYSEGLASDVKSNQYCVVLGISTECMDSLRKYTSPVTKVLDRNVKYPLDFDVKVLTESGIEAWITTEEIVDIIAN